MLVVTRLVFDDEADQVRLSLSGSEKYDDTPKFVDGEVTSVNLRAGIVPSATGERLGTVTSNDSVAVALSGSLAVTVTVALPFARGVIVSVEPETLAVATLVFDEEAE